jgi:hypothetical protein
MLAVSIVRSPRRIYLAVAGCALIVYLGALWNRWAWDDIPIIVYNPLLLSPSALWRAFLSPYSPPALGGTLYRPLTIASYALDLILWGGTAWFHWVNIVWHAGVSVLVAVLARRLSGDRAALVAGLVFAAHPVHVEAVANVVGRAELMAALFALLAVYAALVRDHLWWSLAALAGGLLSKENAAVVPALIAWAWWLGIARPTRARMVQYIRSWVALAIVYGAARTTVLHPYAAMHTIAPVFVGAGPFEIRWTAVAAFADFARLLVFPATLRVDYSPAERTLVSTPFDLRFVAGLACIAVWVTLVVVAWRRGRKVEAWGLGWIGIALSPVANILFPVGVLVAERTLYLPSAGLALAFGAWLPAAAPRVWPIVLAALVVAGGARSFARVPVWRDDGTVILSEFQDSPLSFDGPARMVRLYLNRHDPKKALEAFRVAEGIYDRMPWLYATGADAAFALRQYGTADSLLAKLEQLCSGCDGYYRFEAGAALARGDTLAADSLAARANKIMRPKAL